MYNMDFESEALAYGKALHWFDKEGDSWYRFDGTIWTGWSVKSCFSSKSPACKPCVATPRPMSWRPWTTLMDDSKHPYVSWFEDSSTNITFSAVDAPVLDHRHSHVRNFLQFAYAIIMLQVAFECASAATGVEMYTSLNRFELLSSVCSVSRRLKADLGGELFYSRSERCFFHGRTGFEHVVYVLACARLGVVYTCTTADASDGALAHRLRDFKPNILITTAHPSDDLMTPCNAANKNLRKLHQTCVTMTPPFRAAVVYFMRQGDVAKLCQQTVVAKTCGLYLPPPEAVTDSHALFVVYTSGSTGKPKGVVHGHGGYAACVSRSMTYAFGVHAEDKLLTVGTLAWITGQSYMLYGPLLAGCQSILVQGSPLGVDGLRWALIAESRRATILKIATALVRYGMSSHSQNTTLRELNLSATLRLATFCAEPVSLEVHAWACKNICRNFFNSYWATEHGSIVLTRLPNSSVFEPTTKCWPVPWVKCTLASATHPPQGKLLDIIISLPYAGLARTIWGDIAGYEHPGLDRWLGDIDRFSDTYFPFRDSPGYAFTQGDAARVDPIDHGWTFHGRTDEVLNVSGVRIGVEEIEKVVW